MHPIVYISGFIEPAFKHNPVYRNRGVYISGFIKPASNTIRYTETGLYIFQDLQSQLQTQSSIQKQGCILGWSVEIFFDRTEQVN